MSFSYMYVHVTIVIIATIFFFKSTTTFNGQKQLYSVTISHRSCAGGQELPYGWAHVVIPVA